MRSLNNRQSGLAAVNVVVILVLAVTISGIGFFVHSQRTKTAPAKAATDNSSSAPKTPTKSTSPTPATQATTGATLTIKEWNIQIPLPDSLKDAYYVPSTSSADTDGSVNTVLIGLKSKDTGECGAALGNTGGSSLGVIVRTLPTDTDPVTGKLYTELYSGVVIGKYFYGYGAFVDANNKCGSVDSRAPINDAFGAAVKNSTVVIAQPTRL